MKLKNKDKKKKKIITKKNVKNSYIGEQVCMPLCLYIPTLLPR